LSSALPASSPSPRRVALVGNPNSGKTSLFNQLTGSRQKVANYAGVTVERKEGCVTLPDGSHVRLLDLPGAYSLQATSPDEAITRDVCLGQHAKEAKPELIICVVSASNLRLHLRFLLELMQIGCPILVALNMMDEARRQNFDIDVPGLEAALGVKIVPTVSLRKSGVSALRHALAAPPEVPPARPATSIYAQVDALMSQYTNESVAGDNHLTDRIDRVVLHPVWGMALLFIVLFIMFQSVFTLAQPAMDFLENAFSRLGAAVVSPLPDGSLHSLLQNGVIAGAGSVAVFLPQILVLFFWIIVLEESGYLPRAAFMLDRLMASAGLSGRSFIPLLSSFACAIPGIMAARTVQHPRDRIVTIMIAPLMTCSARLPIYALLIAAFIPRHVYFGFIGLQGLVLFGLYALAILSGIIAARVLTRGAAAEEHILMLELPPYRWPNPRAVLIGLLQRARIFLARVGTVIVSLNVLLWALSCFPPPPLHASQPAISYSLAGKIGHWMLPVFAPIGFNWQICVSLIPGLAAREVAVSALATVYALNATEDTAATVLGPLLSAQWSLATALSLLAWYVYAPQCFSTLAVMRRETNSSKIVVKTAFSLFALAYMASLLTYHMTRFLGGA